MPPSDCDRIDAELSAFIDGELTGDLLREVRQHVDGCNRCGSTVAALRKLTTAVAALPRHAAPESVMADFQNELAGGRQSKSGPEVMSDRENSPAAEPLRFSTAARPTASTMQLRLWSLRALASAAMLLLGMFIGWKVLPQGRFADMQVAAPPAIDTRTSAAPRGLENTRIAAAPPAPSPGTEFAKQPAVEKTLALADKRSPAEPEAATETRNPPAPTIAAEGRTRAAPDVAAKSPSRDALTAAAESPDADNDPKLAGLSDKVLRELRATGYVGGGASVADETDLISVLSQPTGGEVAGIAGNLAAAAAPTSFVDVTVSPETALEFDNVLGAALEAAGQAPSLRNDDARLVQANRSKPAYGIPETHVELQVNADQVLNVVNALESQAPQKCTVTIPGSLAPQLQSAGYGVELGESPKQTAIASGVEMDELSQKEAGAYQDQAKAREYARDERKEGAAQQEDQKSGEAYRADRTPSSALKKVEPKHKSASDGPAQTVPSEPAGTVSDGVSPTTGRSAGRGGGGGAPGQAQPRESRKAETPPRAEPLPTAETATLEQDSLRLGFAADREAKDDQSAASQPDSSTVQSDQLERRGLQNRGRQLNQDMGGRGVQNRADGQVTLRVRIAPPAQTGQPAQPASQPTLQNSRQNP